MRAAGWTYEAIGNHFNLSHARVYQILGRDTYRPLTTSAGRLMLSMRDVRSVMPAADVIRQLW